MADRHSRQHDSKDDQLADKKSPEQQLQDHFEQLDADNSDRELNADKGTVDIDDKMTGKSGTVEREKPAQLDTEQVDVQQLSAQQQSMQQHSNMQNNQKQSECCQAISDHVTQIRQLSMNLDSSQEMAMLLSSIAMVEQHLHALQQVIDDKQQQSVQQQVNNV